MEIFLYTIIFIIGSFFGSFFTLAVYRIPRKEDILIKHSYCPNCNHKLGFFDLFPILSYILLGGKCKYCSQKIRPRYLILEFLAGISFVIFAIGIRVNVFYIYSIINMSFLLLYVSILFIISGIDKENIKIEKSVLICGYVIEVLYIIYQYALLKLNVYQYVIYMILVLILVILYKSKIINFKNQYIMSVIYLYIYILIYSGINLSIITLILLLITTIIHKMMQNKKKKEIPIGFYLSINNILVIIVSNFIINYIL